MLRKAGVVHLIPELYFEIFPGMGVKPQAEMTKRLQVSKNQKRLELKEITSLGIPEDFEKDQRTAR